MSVLDNALYYGKAASAYSQQAMRTLTVTTSGITFSTGTLVTANVAPGTDDGYFIPNRRYKWTKKENMR